MQIIAKELKLKKEGDFFMVSGHLSQKNNYWYIVIELRSDTGKRTPKWIPTGLKIKGNKKRVEELLYEKRLEFSFVNNARRNAKDIYFDEYIALWLNNRQNEIAKATFDSYSFIVMKNIVPYFKKQKILLSDLKPIHIDAYYQTLLNRGLSANTVKRQHANIHKSLDDAIFKELIVYNPANKVKLPKKVEYITTPYNIDECKKLLQKIKGEKLELFVMLAVFTGLRRSELLGLRWKSIDFENNLIHINHSIIRAIINGHQISYGQDKLKRDSSFRTLPLTEPIQDALKAEKLRRNHDSETNLETYIFADAKGEVLNRTM